MTATFDESRHRSGKISGLHQIRDLAPADPSGHLTAHFEAEPGRGIFWTDFFLVKF